jgi:biopolymer transport protein ExbB
VHERRRVTASRVRACAGLRDNRGDLTALPPGSFVWSPDLLSIIQAAGWPIWPLIACSVLGLALVIERFISLKKAKIVPPKLLDEAIMVSRNGVPGPDVVKQLEQNSVLGEVLANGFRTLTSNPRASEEDLRASLEGAGRQAAAKLQRYLGALATIASAAPLLGLLGTVIGMIEIFGSQGVDGGMGVTPGGGNPAQLAHGISIALYNTAFGLIVAIPALMFWRYFRAQVDGYLLTMELAADRFARHLMTLRR